MPVTVVLRECDITLNEETKPIIEAYTKALEHTGLRLKPTDEGVNTKAAPGETKMRNSFWAKHVTVALEQITDKARGAFTIHLVKEELDLEVPAELLLRSYVGFLNSMLLDQEISAQNAEQTTIISKYVLVRELLSRLVKIALSNMLDKQNDGDSLLTALNLFIKAIAEQERLIEKKLFGPDKISNFLSKLTLEHPSWVRQISQMVGMVKLIHQNTQAIKTTLNGLKQTEYFTQIQLIAFLILTKNRMVGLWNGQI